MRFFDPGNAWKLSLNSPKKALPWPIFRSRSQFERTVSVHLQIITPAIVAAALDPIRADEEQGGGIIHKPMFERLILCEYAVGRISRRPTPLAGTVLVQEQLVLALNRAG
jgi:hypothetical protein